jgi:hypothetical protein
MQQEQGAKGSRPQGVWDPRPSSKSKKVVYKKLELLQVGPKGATHTANCMWTAGVLLCENYIFPIELGSDFGTCAERQAEHKIDSSISPEAACRILYAKGVSRAAEQSAFLGTTLKFTHERKPHKVGPL